MSQAPTPPSDDDEYAGLVTRVLAFVLDALVVNLVAAIVTGAVGIALSVLAGGPSVGGTGVFAGALAFGLWSSGYFVVSWTLSGQTIGNVVMRIRVVDARTGGTLAPCRGLVRFVAISLGAIPLLAGLWILLWDRRRRAFHDRVARSVVLRLDAR